MKKAMISSMIIISFLVIPAYSQNNEYQTYTKPIPKTQNVEIGRAHV